MVRVTCGIESRDRVQWPQFNSARRLKDCFLDLSDKLPFLLRLSYHHHVARTIQIPSSDSAAMLFTWVITLVH